MYEQSLTQAGLTEEMAQIYEILLKNGPTPAGKISKKAGLKRGLAYKTLERLLAKGLVEKQEPAGKVAVFSARHPLKLQELVETRQQKTKNAQLALDGVLSSLISDFNLLSGKPDVYFSEGITGLKKIYDDVIREKNDLYLFRSIYDDDQPALKDLVAEQIKKQRQQNIRTYALTPLVSDTPKTILENDEKNLVTRRIIAREKFILDSQIIIYGHKVAIISLKNKIICTAIDNADIAKTFKAIFDYVWQAAESEHKEIKQQILAG